MLTRERIAPTTATLRALLAAPLLAAALSACGEGKEGPARTSTGPPATTRASDPRAPTPRPVVAQTAATARPAAETTPPAHAPREVTYGEAETAFRDRRYDEALELFEAWTERRPRNPWGHYMLGLSAWKVGRLERAVAGFEGAIELDSAHLKSRVNLSRVLLELERPSEALPHVERALELDPESGDAWRVAGNVLSDLGRPEEAETAYRRAIQLDKRDAWALNNLGLLLIRQGRYEEALGPLALATEIRPELGVAHNNLGVALERTGHLSAAARAYRGGSEGDPHSERAAASLARLEAAGVDPDAEGGVDVAELAREFEIDAPAVVAGPEPEGE